VHILLLNYEYPPNGGGAGNATRELGKAFVGLGHEVTVITSQTPTFIGETEDCGVKVHRIRTRRRREASASLFEMGYFLATGLLAATRLGRRHSIDLTICFFSLPVGPLGWCLKKLYGVPYLISLRGGDVPEVVPEMRYLHYILGPVRRLVLSRAVAVVANSKFLAEQTMAVDQTAVKVIPNGVDSSFFQKTFEDSGRISVGETKVIFAGRFHSQKDVPGLLQKLDYVRKRTRLEFRLTLVGDGPQRREVETIAANLSWGQVIDFPGWLPKEALREAYQESDLFINLSHYEGLPNTVLEAMACGLVVIVSDIPAHREIITHGETGMLVSISDPIALGDSLRSLISDDLLRQRIASRARQMVCNEYRWRTSAKAYLNVYESRV
jgi:glycosyltransferase involved in cell wall biosynthesis